VGWGELLDEYVQIAKQEPERFDCMVDGNRTHLAWADGATTGAGSGEGRFLW